MPIPLNSTDTWGQEKPLSIWATGSPTHKKKTLNSLIGVNPLALLWKLAIQFIALSHPIMTWILLTKVCFYNIRRMCKSHWPTLSGRRKEIQSGPKCHLKIPFSSSMLCRTDSTTWPEIRATATSPLSFLNTCLLNCMLCYMLVTQSLRRGLCPPGNWWQGLHREGKFEKQKILRES